MSRLTDLLAKATPRPWLGESAKYRDEWYTVPILLDNEGNEIMAGDDDAALLVALVNHADAIQALWDAAIEHTEGRDVSAYELRDAVEALRDLCGGDAE